MECRGNQGQTLHWSRMSGPAFTIGSFDSIDLGSFVMRAVNMINEEHNKQAQRSTRQTERN